MSFFNEIPTMGRESLRDLKKGIDLNFKEFSKNKNCEVLTLSTIKKESIDFNDLLVDKNNDDNEDNLNSIPATGVDLKKSVTDLEIALIKEALKKSDGNVSKAAKLLTLGRTTLIEKINKLKKEKKKEWEIKHEPNKTGLNYIMKKNKQEKKDEISSYNSWKPNKREN